MDEDSGLLALTIFVVVVLGFVFLFKGSQNKRDKFVVEIEEWLKSTNKDYRTYFKIDFPKKYSDFKKWKEGDDGEK